MEKAKKYKNRNLAMVLIFVIVAALLTWIFQGSFINQDNTIQALGRQPFNISFIADSLSVFLQTFSVIAVFFLAIAMFYGTLNNTSIYRRLLDKIVKVFKGKEQWFLVIVSVLFALLTSMIGFSFGMVLLLFVPMVITIIRMLGYDKETSVIYVVVPIALGLAATTTGLSNIGLIKNVVPEYGSYTHIWIRVALLVAGLAIMIFNILKNSNKHRDKDTKYENLILPENSNDKKYIWPIALMFIVLVVFLVLAFLPWNEWKVTFFDELVMNMQSAKIGKWAIFSELFGKIPSFGNWSLIHVSVLLFLVTYLIAIFSKMRYSDFVTARLDAIKSSVKPIATVTVMQYAMFILMMTGVAITILQPFLELQSFNIVLFIIAILLIALLIPDRSFAIVMFLGMLILPFAGKAIAMGSIFSIINGLTMLIFPTSILLLAVMSYAGLNYKRYVKRAWPIALEMFAAGLVASIVALFI